MEISIGNFNLAVSLLTSVPPGDPGFGTPNHMGTAGYDEFEAPKEVLMTWSSSVRRLHQTSETGGTGSWWSGPITPIRSTKRLHDILDDIHHHRPVYTLPDGELCHFPACREYHCAHPWTEMIRPEGLMRTFDVRIYYSGDHDDPRCWIKGIDLTNGRHMWSDGSICPFLSSSASWDWMTNTVADFVGHVSVWLVSWMVFQQAGIWIVGEHGNTG